MDITREVEIRHTARRAAARLLRTEADSRWADTKDMTLAERIVFSSEMRTMADLVDVEP